MSEAGPLDRLIERSRRIGERADLVVHGGGNTSTKTTAVDHLGRSRRVLIVKASGTDLRTIDAAGFVELYLDELLFAREQEDMDDDRMMSFVDRCLVRPTRRRASIETLLHAFLPARDVDHVHADAICALTKAPNPEGAVREALGGDVAYVDYVRPGFGLAKLVAALAGHEAVVLGHHGLVTWSDDGRSLDRAIELVERAERHMTNARRASVTADSASLSGDATEALLLGLRSRLSRESRVVLHVDRSARRISDRPDVNRIAEAGPATADHLLLVRPWSVVVRSDADVAPAIDAYEDRYRSYWERHAARAPGGYGMRSSLPAVIVVPGLGVIGTGRSKGQARKVAEVAAHTHAVAASATDVFGAAVTLSDEDLFDIDYWPLELAMITRPAISCAPAGAIFASSSGQ